MKLLTRIFRFTILFAMLALAVFGGTLTQAKNSPVDQPFAKGDSIACNWGDFVLNANDANVLNGASATGTLNQVSMLVCASNAPKVPNVPGTPAKGAQKVTLSPCPDDGTTLDLPVPAAIERIAKGSAVLAGQSCPVVPPVVTDKTNNSNHFGTNKVKVTLCPSGTTSEEMTIPRATNLIAAGNAVALGGTCPVVADAGSETETGDTDTDGEVADIVIDPILPSPTLEITLPNDNWSTEVVDEVIIIINPGGNIPPGQQSTPAAPTVTLPNTNWTTQVVEGTVVVVNPGGNIPPGQNK